MSPGVVFKMGLYSRGYGTIYHTTYHYFDKNNLLEVRSFDCGTILNQFMNEISHLIVEIVP